MKQYGISEALTNDHHFEQAGLIKLLWKQISLVQTLQFP
jgi:predicted nucleic acid-binding protein